MNTDLETAMAYNIQAIGRVKRLGQTRDTVHVWRFVCEGTVEDEINAEHQLEMKTRNERKEALRVRLGRGIRVGNK
jgi:hypothetical protein